MSWRLSRSTGVPDADGFSLVAGGPLYQMYLRTRLSGPALVPVHRLIAGAVLIGWFPLFLLTLLEGGFHTGTQIPFLYDLEVHTRLLAAAPLLLAAETIVHRLLRPIVTQFVDRGIVTPADRERFADLIESAMRLRNSVAIELVLLAGAIGFGYWLWNPNPIHGAQTWYADTAGHLTHAGYWYGFVSLPILRFLLLRWYFRLSVWYGFLGSVRSLPLHLNLFHPDRAGGLGFLALSVPAFTPVLVAQSIMVSGIIGNRIWHAGMSLSAFKMQILAVTLFLMLTVLAPLFSFTPLMAEARRIALRELGTLASRYVEEFRAKWLGSRDPQTEPLLGAPDLQSLADLGTAYDTTSNMATVPFTKRTLAQLAITILLPIAPLTLTLMPVDKMIDGLVKLLL